MFVGEDLPKVVAGAAQRSGSGCQLVLTPNSLPGSSPGPHPVSTDLLCLLSSPSVSPRDRAASLPSFTPRLSSGHREFPE